MDHIALKRKFVDQFGKEPLMVRSPGRINMIGEHTDYNDGLVMPAAIDKEIVFAIAAADGISTVHALDMNESVSIDLADIHKVQAPAWLNYLLGIIHRLHEQGYKIKPFHCAFGGDIPLGAGLSSSAALECGFVFALNALFGLNMQPIDMVLTAQWAEHHYAGVKCGIMDQFSTMMGRQHHVFILDCRSLEYNYFPLSLFGYELVLLDSNVKHSLASSEYNTRRLECEEGVSILQKKNKDIKSLRDTTPAFVMSCKESMPQNVYDRCLYVTQETERVKSAGEDLRNGDLKSFGAKMYATHEGLSSLYKVSCTELDFLVGIAKTDPSVLGARMMGGGFGGCTINIVRTEGVAVFIENSIRAYKERFNIVPAHYKVKIQDGTSII